MNKMTKVVLSICLLFGIISLLTIEFTFNEQPQSNLVKADNPKEVAWQSFSSQASDDAIESSPLHTIQVTDDAQPIFISSSSPIQYKQTEKKNYIASADTIYSFMIAHTATATITVRTLKNDTQFVFISLENNGDTSISIDVFQAIEHVAQFRLNRYDRYPLKRDDIDAPSYDLNTLPTGILQLKQTDGSIVERVVGQAYRSKPLALTYPDGSQSFTRELYNEQESFSYYSLYEKFYMFHRLSSAGHDIVDSWYMEAKKPLFKSDEALEAWIQESAINYRKRNSWYTAQGPYNKMALTVEPMPASQKGYGRNLLLVKEDRALELYRQQGDLYFESIVQNSLTNLDIFKGDKALWETEVTSTYLKDLYGFTAPFIDTRFNEQIALFYMRANDVMPIENGLKPLRHYADFLIAQQQAGNVITVGQDAYYLPDYYSVKGQVTTHASMNHLLGGIAILLHAYEHFGDDKYVTVAKAQMNAIALQEDDWIRPNQDIWYKINTDLTFVGTDYVHLTLEDLTYVYYLWSNIDTQYLPLLERMIAAKAQFLTNEDKGYTEKIKTNLARINMLHYLPN